MNISNNINDILHETVLLLGQTGGGKSSVANTLLKVNIFKESSSYKSETDNLQIANGKFFGNGILLSVIDTPGLREYCTRRCVELECMSKK